MMTIYNMRLISHRSIIREQSWYYKLYRINWWLFSEIHIKDIPSWFGQRHLYIDRRADTILHIYSDSNFGPAVNDPLIYRSSKV
jgi:hypothetical protein